METAGAGAPRLKHKTREAWLVAALAAIRSLFEVQDRSLPVPEKLRVSCGWPGGGSARKRIGECWTAQASADGVTEIFISPSLAEPVRVLDVLVHEGVHAAVGVEHGHKGPFRRLALAVGLTGKMRATVAGPALVEQLTKIARGLGRYPHGQLNPGVGRKKQSTRMLKCECMKCGYVARTTGKWIASLGPPICPGCERPMECDDDVESGGED